MSEAPIRVFTLFGTRPELIKLCPVIRELDHDPQFESVVVSTAQHREMIDDLIELFQVRLNHDLNLIQRDQSLAALSSRAMAGLDPLIERHAPDLLLVQGDTTTAFIGALAAFYRQVAIGHVEAGLRSKDKWQPFPEEINRRLISVVADLHFAPTSANAQALVVEGVDRASVFVTGNTVIDSLLTMAEQPAAEGLLPREALAGRIVLVTAHRRENFGQPLAELCHALTSLVEDYPDLHVVYPVHLNPRVRETVMPILRDNPQVHLLDPLRYDAFVQVMNEAYLIITDSGGIQEEAPSLGKPVLVVRNVTERTETVAHGGAQLVGLERKAITTAASKLLRDRGEHQRRSVKRHLYGDGQASQRITAAILNHFGRGPRPSSF